MLVKRKKVVVNSSGIVILLRICDNTHVSCCSFCILYNDNDSKNCAKVSCDAFDTPNFSYVIQDVKKAR